MAANRNKHDGVPRGGPALLGGIIRCGHCGRRMSLAYHNNGREARYQCCQLAITFGGPRCQSVSAQPVDGLVAELILAALAPSAIEVSLQAAEDIELERTERQRHWSQRLERARYETTLARRRDEAVDPQNRLVARTLERDWDAALGFEQKLAAEHARELARPPARLQAAELDTIRTLRQQGRSAAAIAEQLNAAGWRPPKCCAFNASMVQRLAFRHKLGSARPIWSSNVPRKPGVEWTLHEAAARLGIHRHTA